MQIKLTFMVENSTDVLTLTELLDVARIQLEGDEDVARIQLEDDEAVFDSEILDVDEHLTDAAIARSNTVTNTGIVTVDTGAPLSSTGLCPPSEPKKRGRKPKPKPVEVVAVVPAASPSAQIEALVEAAKSAAGVPETPVGAVTTGQQLQEYILSLIHQKRLDPVSVKAKVYPKYGVVRSLDLTAEQVPLAKADVDAMLKGGAPAPENDLDL